VQLILDYLKGSGETCISRVIPGEQLFKACREVRGSLALTIVTGLPVRNDDGWIIDTCSANLTATIVPGFEAVRTEVAAEACPEKTRWRVLPHIRRRNPAAHRVGGKKGKPI
jgi:hypothetical protein